MWRMSSSKSSPLPLIITVVALLAATALSDNTTDALVLFYPSSTCEGTGIGTTIAPDTCTDRSSDKIGFKIQEDALCANGTAALWAIYHLPGCNDTLSYQGTFYGIPGTLPTQVFNLCLNNAYGSFAFWCNGSDAVTAQGNPPSPAGSISIYDDATCGTSQSILSLPIQLNISQCYANLSSSLYSWEPAKCPGDGTGNGTANLYMYQDDGCSDDRNMSYALPAIWKGKPTCWNTTSIKSIQYKCNGVAREVRLGSAFLAGFASLAILYSL
ncbi:uncharacterized protein PAC_09025 [Phialocephala subalpina]|uniref:Cyanovirin-N domain-containing protein n=1 Tax=Phialocephala subalpina TaxID=576137 RepID=A0A1L7X280_9HELO|nr:uncharacterized protein PAC_09025 [Phialocephala subalpina]